MYIADELCDRVAFIVDGELKRVDSPKNLKLQFGQKLVDIEYLDNGQLKTQTFSTQDTGDKQQLKQIIDQHEVVTLHTKEATLEEIFIKVTGRGLA